MSIPPHCWNHSQSGSWYQLKSTNWPITGWLHGNSLWDQIHLLSGYYSHWSDPLPVWFTGEVLYWGISLPIQYLADSWIRHPVAVCHLIHSWFSGNSLRQMMWVQSSNQYDSTAHLYRNQWYLCVCVCVRWIHHISQHLHLQWPTPGQISYCQTYSLAVYVLWWYYLLSISVCQISLIQYLLQIWVSPPYSFHFLYDC